MNVGFVGLGIMGAPMAGHLIGGGHSLALKTRRQVPESLVAAGGRACATAAAVAECSDVIILMLPDTPDVEAVLFGADGVAEGARRGAVVVDMSSISPIATRDFAARLSERGVDYLDAPVSGGEVGAKNAALSIMVGGRADVFARVKPLLDLMGKTVTHVGETGGRSGRQGRQPDHRRAHHRGGGGRAALRLEGRSRIRPRSGRRSPGGSPPRASSSFTARA